MKTIFNKEKKKKGMITGSRTNGIGVQGPTVFGRGHEYTLTYLRILRNLASQGRQITLRLMILSYRIRDSRSLKKKILIVKIQMA